MLAVLLVITCLAVVVLALVQRQREARALAEYYQAILEDAPCISSVCPGFDGGRAQALELLEQDHRVSARLQGTYIISFDLVGNQGEIINGGGLFFDTDADGVPTKVNRILFSLYWVEGLTLESVFKVLGEPDEYLFVSGCGMGTRVHAKLLYLQRGVDIGVEYAARRPSRQVLKGETPVRGIEYFEPENLRGHLSESLAWYILGTIAYDLDPSVTEDDFVSQIRPWPGLDARPTPSADFCPR